MKHDEYVLQTQVVQALREHGWVVFSIPNERNGGIADSKRMKAAGLTKGAPDLVCYKRIDGWLRCCWLELKTPTGKRSPEQECMEDVAFEIGIQYYLVKSIYDISALLN